MTRRAFFAGEDYYRADSPATFLLVAIRDFARETDPVSTPVSQARDSRAEAVRKFGDAEPRFKFADLAHRQWDILVRVHLYSEPPCQPGFVPFSAGRRSLTEWLANVPKLLFSPGRRCSPC